LLTSFIYRDEDSRFRVAPDESSTSTPNNGFLAETQYLFREESFNAIVGGGYYKVNQHFETEGSRLTEKTSHGITYLYARTQFPSSVTWTLGLGGDFFDSDGLTRKISQINPKFGIMWNITAKTVFRAAWIRTFKRSALFNQTLEPTQVAGFNQLFDDPTGTKSERWGVGIDHRFSSVISGGIEVSQRKLTVAVEGPGSIEEHWKEALYRGYLQITPHPRWAVQIEYLREKFNNFESFGPRDTDTQTVPFSVSYFSPSGFFAKLRASYLKQNVGVDSGSGSDSATFLDLGLGYRLPSRLGILELQLQNMLNQHYRYEGLQNRSPPERTGVPSFLPFPPSFTALFRFSLAL
jgi:hypothetical protein